MNQNNFLNEINSLVDKILAETSTVSARIFEDNSDEEKVYSADELKNLRRMTNANYNAQKVDFEYTHTNGREDYIVKVSRAIGAVLGFDDLKSDLMFSDKVKQTEEFYKKTPRISQTMLKNVHEHTIYSMLSDLEKKQGSDAIDAVAKECGIELTFDSSHAQNILKSIKYEWGSVLKDFTDGSTGKVAVPSFHYYDPKIYDDKYDNHNKKNPIWGGFETDTAAINREGVITVSIPFLKKIFLVGKLKGFEKCTLRHGKKYKSYGVDNTGQNKKQGTIPDEYRYLETVMLHEILHYKMGDFVRQKKYKLKMKLVNYTADFINNHKLMELGYTQLPMGLYNNELNGNIEIPEGSNDRAFSYCYKIIEKELQDIKDDDERKKAEENLDKSGDDHETSSDDIPEDGDESDSGEDGDESESGDKSGKKPARVDRRGRDGGNQPIPETDGAVLDRTDPLYLLGPDGRRDLSGFSIHPVGLAESRLNAKTAHKWQTAPAISPADARADRPSARCHSPAVPPPLRAGRAGG